MDKLDLILQKIESIDGRLDRLETRMDRLETKVDRLEVRMNNLEVRMNNLEARMDNLETRMDKLEARMDRLESELADTKEDLGGKIDSIKLEMENRIYPSISIIAENHLDLYRHLKTVVDFRPSHDALEIRVSALEYSMGRVKEVIQNLKSA